MFKKLWEFFKDYREAILIIALVLTLLFVFALGVARCIDYIKEEGLGSLWYGEEEWQDRLEKKLEGIEDYE